MKRAILLVVLVMAAAACNGEKFAEGKQMFRELLTLRDQLGKEFHEKVVDVNVANGAHLTVKFINSPLQSQSVAAKQERANAVAAFVAKNYPRPVKSVTTEFAANDAFTGQMPRP